MEEVTINHKEAKLTDRARKAMMSLATQEAASYTDILLAYISLLLERIRSKQN